jgi:hypothetical protein
LDWDDSYDYKDDRQSRDSKLKPGD